MIQNKLFLIYLILNKQNYHNNTYLQMPKKYKIDNDSIPSLQNELQYEIFILVLLINYYYIECKDALFVSSKEFTTTTNTYRCQKQIQKLMNEIQYEIFFLYY